MIRQIKYSVLTVLILTIPLISYAQEQRHPAQLGFRGGLNYSTLTGGDVLESDYKIGANFGLVSSFNFTPRVGMQFEALFTQKGGEMQQEHMQFFTTDEVVTHSTMNLNYVEVPILLKLTWPLDKMGPRPYRLQRHNFFWSLYTGPYGGYFLSGESEGRQITTQYMGPDTLQTIMPYHLTLNDSLINPIDFGIVFGTELKIHMGRDVHFVFDVRVTRGFNTIDKRSFGYFDENAKYHIANIVNQNLAASVGITMHPRSFIRPFMSAQARDSQRRRGL